MAAPSNPLRILAMSKPRRATGSGSLDNLRQEASNEFVFAVVGHAGSGTTQIAKSLNSILSEMEITTEKFDVEILKARNVIEEWAKRNNLPMPGRNQQKKLLSDVEMMQDYGDQMRSETNNNGQSDHAAVALGLIRMIQRVRAQKVGHDPKSNDPVDPDGKPRAYILDSIRHPAEVRLLRSVYGDAFVLIGVVCEEGKRLQRISDKYDDAGKVLAQQFMKRDANDASKHGQHVADAFHLADFFVDNTGDRTRKGKANVKWNLTEDLGRLAKIVTNSELVRPKVSETAMFHAFSAQMQSACLSRQVGAAIVDATGNLVATGSNEAPKAGGGVYGESFQKHEGEEKEEEDHRCAYFNDPNERYCRNTREQNMIIDELMASIDELKAIEEPRRTSLREELRKTRIGGLLEFSRAVHAEMDALLSAARKGVPLTGCRLFVTTYPCHYCARHIVTAGIDEVQYIEPYPKSQALNLHRDSIATEAIDWTPPSSGGTQVLFRPFSGVAPRLYERAFLKVRELKDKATGVMRIQEPDWTDPWYLPKKSYIEIEAGLTNPKDPGSCNDVHNR